MYDEKNVLKWDKKLDHIKTLANMLIASLIQKSPGAYIYVQKSFSNILKLSSSISYHNTVDHVMNAMGLTDAKDTKSKLRENITDELGTDSETCVAPDADDLVYLDDNKYIAMVNFDDIQDLPDQNVLWQFIRSLKHTLNANVKANA